MSDSEPTPNPYAPTSIVDDSAVEELWDGKDGSNQHLPQESVNRLSLTKTAIRWLLVCTISALPSFVYGMLVTEGEIAAMVLGILIFSAGYTLLDYRTAAHPWRQRPEVRRTLRITYGTRIAISILFPIGGFLDVLCGLATIAAVRPFFANNIENQAGFFVALIMTLVQGCVLNLVLGSYGLLVHLIQTAFLAFRRRQTRGTRS